jgi:hypothetical protein
MICFSFLFCEAGTYLKDIYQGEKMSEVLLPERHPDNDLFICDLGDVIPKCDMASMEHPLFTLSTKPDLKIRHYEHNNVSVTISPSVSGMATIFDKDILIYAISKLMAGLNRGEALGRTIRFKAHDMLISTNRHTGGRNYKLLTESFKRLRGTGIETTIKTNGKEHTKGFGLIESYEVIREDNKKRMIDVEITLSEWLYGAVVGKEVVTINRDYFRLRKPIERRVYEIARKHCNKKAHWCIGIKKLHKKVGSSGTVRKFKLTLKGIIENNHLPDYSINMDGDNVLFTIKKDAKRALELNRDKPRISSKAIEVAKKLVINKFDVYQLEQEWLEFWEKSGSPELKSNDAAFTAFCKKKVVS